MTMHEFLHQVSAKNADQPEFIQAVSEVVETIWDVYDSNPQYRKAKILDRIVEPDRIIIFRVPWTTDAGEVMVNRGYRVEFNAAIGPYKGGLRFHPSVNLGILKFLGFEQIFKNSLTTLPMGGGKGGSDFNPRGRSDDEVMRFCHSFMLELFRHIGPDTDVPAGDIGVGKREIGFLYGMYKKIKNEATGVLTGKGLEWGGSLIRPEATGFGTVYFAEEMLKTKGQSFDGKTVLVSGSGNVSQYAIQKVNDLGGKVVTASDSDGFIHDPDGIKGEKWEYLMELKNIKRGRISEYAEEFGVKYYPGARPWGIPGDVALPCATQNEINGEEARTLIKNGCICVSEGANMPTTPEGAELILDAKILYGPGKAANAGGVATSGLEMTQNSMRISWSREEVDTKLHSIMRAIHESCVQYGKKDNYVNYVRGANVAGFIKVANAMMDQGLV
ncbi:MAG: NADP-specific glutamate dehydrogenase [Candidatus Cloacimonadota bacterium]